jgi:hypothetical protein
MVIRLRDGKQNQHESNISAKSSLSSERLATVEMYVA